MRICMIGYTNYHRDGRIRREAESLVRRGIQVDFIGIREPKEAFFRVIEGVRVFNLPIKKYRGNNPILYIESYTRFLIESALFAFTMHFARQYSLVQVHTMPDFISLAGLPLKALGIPLIIDIHDTVPELYMSGFKIPSNHPIIQLLKLQEKLGISISNAGIVVHKPHLNLLRSRGIKKDLTIVMNLPDERIFGKPSKPGNQKKIIYHGTVLKRLGVDLLIKSAPKVLQKHPDAKFYIYGGGEWLPYCKKLCNQMGLQDHFYFSGKLAPIHTVPSLIQDAWLEVIPTRKDPATEYMLPGKLLECILMRIPVIAPRTIAITSYFPEDSLYFCNTEDPEELANTINYVLSHFDEAKQKAEQTYKSFFSKYSWKKEQERYYSLIKKWAKSPPYYPPSK